MSFVTVEKPRPYITLITLNRPERMNAMAFDAMTVPRGYRSNAPPPGMLTGLYFPLTIVPAFFGYVPA